MGLITLKDSNGDEVIVDEGESCNLTATFSLGSTAFTKSDLDSLTLTLYDRETLEVINSRENQNILDDNQGNVTTAGVLTLKLNAADNPIVSTTNTAQGKVEEHIARIKWTWTDSAVTRTGIAEFLFKVKRLLVPTSA